MWLFLLLIFLNSFFNFVCPYSIFVKISWRENGENNQNYYKRLAREDDERFKLELTGDNLDSPIIGLTDINDSFYFEGLNGDNIKLKITIYGLIDADIGTIYEILENDLIIYIIPCKDNTKYIKYIKVEEKEDFFENLIYLFNNLRVLKFIWHFTNESSQKINNIMIKCKDTNNTNFVANFNNIVNDEDGSGQDKSTNYVKTFICPNDEYTLLVDYKIELAETSYHNTSIKYNGNIYSHHSKTLWIEIKCPPAIHSNNMVNAYRIDFDNPSTGHNCQFILDEQTIVDNYAYVLDNDQEYVDQEMKEIFDEENADWKLARRSKKHKGKKLKSLSSINYEVKSKRAKTEKLKSLDSIRQEQSPGGSSSRNPNKRRDTARKSRGKSSSRQP
uniref:Uncharacterized protein n=1 Tax=Meloidogyne javanica TaxID=6303 RepID=A0A915LGR5_MELJA